MDDAAFDRNADASAGDVPLAGGWGAAPARSGVSAAAGSDAEWMLPPEAAAAEPRLDQDEIDEILGYGPRRLSTAAGGGVRAMVESGSVAYERLPVLEVVFDRAVALLATSLRNFFQDTVEVRLEGISSVRFGDYLDSIPLPAQVAVFRAEGWDNCGLLTVSSPLAFATFDLLLGGKRGATAARSDGRPFTAIEVQLIRRLVEVVLDEVQQAFQPLSPVRLSVERLERNPRFATIARPANAAVLVAMRLDMDGRGGDLQLVLPYATIEPIRDLLVQSFIGETLERDRVWEGHLATEIWQADVAVEAVLHEARVPLQKILALEVGATLMFEARPHELVTLRSGGWTLAQGRVGRMDDRIAVQVAGPLSRPRTSLAAFEANLNGRKDG